MLILGECFPLVFDLLPDKCSPTYHRFWEIIAEAIIRRFGDLGELQRATFHFDFETAAFSNLHAIFGWIILK